MTTTSDRVRCQFGKLPLQTVRLARSTIEVVIPVYPLDQLRAAKTDHDPEAAVYFLWRGPRLIYVGFSRYLGVRLRQHELARKFKFDSATWLEAEDDPIFLQAIESAYIQAYRPPLNELPGGNIVTSRSA